MRMQDAEMVEAILAGQTAGMAAAYDRYAPALYAYCCGLLGEPADAADAVQDTFIIAAGRLGGLRDPARLRPWLYAVARNECRRRLRSRALAAPLDEAGEMTDESADVAVDAEKAELRALVAAALAGLNAGDREIIELNLRHDLAGRDLADALGVGLNQAHALASRARSQLETSLGALLVARSGRESCGELAAILSGWDGQLNVLLRKRINRHIERCELCGARRRRELSPAMLLGLLPVALIPAGLRDQLFALVGDFSAGPSAYRAGVINRAGPFSHSGFPKPLDPPQPVQGKESQFLAAGAGAAAVIVVAGLLFAPHGLKPPEPNAPVPNAGAPLALSPSAIPGVAPPGAVAADAPRARARAGALGPALPGSVPIFPVAAAKTPMVPVSRSTPPGTKPPSPKPPTPTPTPPPPTPTPTPTDTPTPTPTDTPTITPTDTSTSPPPASAAGTLAVPATLAALELGAAG